MTKDSTRRFAKTCEIIDSFGREPSKLIPILQAVQEEYRYLPEDVMTVIATSLGISPARVFGVATFFSHFTLKPKGKYIIRVCDGTACHVKKSHGILEELYSTLKLSPAKTTTDDMLFTLETVSCLGACGLAPVVVINEEVHGQMTPETTRLLIHDIIKKEADNDAKAG